MTPEELIKSINTDIQKAEDFKDKYIQVYKDVIQGVDLERHLKEIEGEIIVIDKMIADAKGRGDKTDSFNVIRGELCRLVYEIKEKL